MSRPTRALVLSAAAAITLALAAPQTAPWVLAGQSAIWTMVVAWVARTERLWDHGA